MKKESESQKGHSKKRAVAQLQNPRGGAAGKETTKNYSGARAVPTDGEQPGERELFHWLMELEGRVDKAVALFAAMDHHMHTLQGYTDCPNLKSATAGFSLLGMDSSEALQEAYGRLWLAWQAGRIAGKGAAR